MGHKLLKEKYSSPVSKKMTVLQSASEYCTVPHDHQRSSERNIYKISAGGMRHLALRLSWSGKTSLLHSSSWNQKGHLLYPLAPAMIFLPGWLLWSEIHYCICIEEFLPQASQPMNDEAGVLSQAYSSVSYHCSLSIFLESHSSCRVYSSLKDSQWLVNFWRCSLLCTCLSSSETHKFNCFSFTKFLTNNKLPCLCGFPFFAVQSLKVRKWEIKGWFHLFSLSGIAVLYCQSLNYL